MFRGSIVALITPFRNGGIDEAALQALVEWHVEQGTHGLVPVGTTGTENVEVKFEVRPSSGATDPETGKGEIEFVQVLGELDISVTDNVQFEGKFGFTKVPLVQDPKPPEQAKPVKALVGGTLRRGGDLFGVQPKPPASGDGVLPRRHSAAPAHRRDHALPHEGGSHG